jgi:flagellar protein FlaG
MRIGFTSVPTPIVSSIAPQMEQPRNRERPPNQAAEPMVVQVQGAHIELEPGELARVVAKLNETVRIFNHALEFQVGEDRVIVRVIDTKSGTVVREIPPENLLDVFNRLEQLVGLVLDLRA